MIMSLDAFQQDVLLDALRAEGMWMPKYQILSHYWHGLARVQSTLAGIMEMSQTPIHFIQPVTDLTSEQTARHLGLWERIRMMKNNFSMDLLANNSHRYMLDHQIPSGEQQFDISNIPTSVYNINNRY